MSQNTSVESSTRSSPNPSINPVLQAALATLDVQLEEELARYRRQRAGRPVMTPRGLGRHQTRKPIELISVDKPGRQTQPPALGMSTAAPILSFPLVSVNPAPAAAPPQETNRELMAQAGQLEAASEPALPPVVLPQNQVTAEHSMTQASAHEQLAPPQEPAAVRGDLVPLAAAQAPPEDYLESSEQLLRSLGEQEADIQPQKRSTNRVLTPLGIGSILLLLLSSATVGYILTNPSTFSALGLNRLFGSKTATTAQSRTQTAIPNSAPVKDSPTVNGPNLASDEFKDVTLNNLSHLEASPMPTPPLSPVPPLPDLPNQPATSAPLPVVPNSALPRRSSDLSSLLGSTLQQGTVPAPVAPPVAPLPAPAASAPTASVSPRRTPNPSPAKSKRSPAPATPATPTATKTPQASPAAAQVAASPAAVQDKFYYVFINYEGDRTLEQARTVVPDAYVRNFSEGTRIQMGAFKRESEAKTLVKQLQQQGISASIHHPND